VSTTHIAKFGKNGKTNFLGHESLRSGGGGNIIIIREGKNIQTQLMPLLQ